jgi:hypothetical protein
MNITCPFCDSNEVEKVVIEEKFPVPFCEDAIIPHETYRCNSCEEEGDFDRSLEKNLTAAIDKANNDSAPKLMEDLKQQGITMTYFEKALRLPFKTTSRWKRGEISHAALALLRIVHFSPFLLAVADDDFSDAIIAKYQLTRPWEFFEKNTSNPDWRVEREDNQIEISFNGQIGTNAIPADWEISQERVG